MKDMYKQNAAEWLAGESGDALLIKGDASVVLPSLPDQCVHMAMTSPPYWAQRRYEGDSVLGNERAVAEYVERLTGMFRELRRILRRDGSFWLNVGDTYREKCLVGVPWRVALRMIDDGWIMRNAIVWDKVKGNPCNANDKLRNVYEMVFHFTVQTEYYYDIDAERTRPLQPTIKNGRVVTPTGVSGAKYRRQIVESEHLSQREKAAALEALEQALEKVRRGEMPDFRMVIRGQQRATHSDSPEFSGRADELRKRGFCILPYHPSGSKPGDVWRIIPEDEWRKDLHYAVFPLELCKRPIRLTCPPGGIVLDPFVGTGTTIVATLLQGKRGIGIDTSGEYLQVANERIKLVKDTLKRETAQGVLL